MTDLFRIFLEEPEAVFFGTAGFCCQLIWPFFRTKRAILTAQFGAGANYAAQYGLLDAWSGASVAALGACQTAILLFAGERSWPRHLAPAMLPTVAIVCIATWHGFASFLALVAVSFVMIGRLQRDTIRLRLFLLASAPFGMGYDILMGAVPALIGGSVSAAIALAMLFREMRERRQETGFLVTRKA